MAETLKFRGGNTIDVNNGATTVSTREIVIDTDTDQIVSGPNKLRTVMEDSNGDVEIGGALTAGTISPSTADSAAAPGIALFNDPDTGFFRVGSNNLGITTQGVERARIVGNFFRMGGTESAPNISLQGNTGGASFSGSVSIGGTAAANTIDEYEEGTFTPGFSIGGTAITLVSPTAGSYTRVGNTCHLNLSLRVNSADYAGATGALTITGLPFTSPNTTASNYSIGSVGLRGFVSDYSNGTKTMYAYNSSGSNALALANGEQDNGQLTEAVLSGTCRLYVTISYRIA